jgi:hypothetical protein
VISPSTTVMASDGAAASATCSPGLAGFAERSLGLFPTAKQAANTILIREGEA